MQSSVRSLLCLLMSLTMLVAGCASSVPVSESQHTNDGKVVQGQAALADKDGTNTDRVDIVKITVYRATPDAMYLVPEVHQVTRNESPAKTAIEFLMAEPTIKGVVSPIPAGTVLRKLVIKDHIAYVDFSNKIVRNNVGGSASERLLVGSIVNTLTEFPEIEKVQILVEGKTVETISGHVDISEPLSRSAEIIKK
ncbi:hypothetical protein SDC9_123346 [bioreactor metagenome]|uniref:GerMN domain-containing protein n=1 Tax=bioreactor metagenome TaxID=1076179 RepID=A0A645CHH6_9ZZZZ